MILLASGQKTTVSTGSKNKTAKDCSECDVPVQAELFSRVCLSASFNWISFCPYTITNGLHFTKFAPCALQAFHGDTAAQQRTLLD